jgi:hypothetical protein
MRILLARLEPLLVEVGVQVVVGRSLVIFPEVTLAEADLVEGPLGRPERP